MDETDSKIIEELKEDSRKPFTEIAEKVGVSEGTVRNRVESLQEEGTIEKFTVETSGDNPVVVMVETHPQADINRMVEEMPDNMKIMEVTGEYDMIVKFSRDSPGELNNILDSIRQVEGVSDTKTYTVLKTRSV